MTTERLVDTTREMDSTWPNELPFTGAGFARVETIMSCVLTRFRLRSFWSLIPFYCAFRRVRKASREIGGLLQAVFLVENLRTCYTLSLWSNDNAIVEFGTRVHDHIHAANSAFAPTYNWELRRPEIWSAQFRLWAVSCCNLNWEGLDMRELLGGEWKKREFVNRGQYSAQGQTDAH
jgi:hypothetical protein